MSGDVVVYLPNDSRFKLAVCAKDFGGDEVALRQAAEANGWQGFVTATEYEALQAKLDAVTKDADGLREALKIAAGYMVEYAGLCKITGFDKLIPRITESADRIVALTDQGRAGEGSR